MFKVYNGTVSPYTNPLAPVHIVSGSAGCRENTDMFVSDPGPWSARRSSDYGFGILRVHNATHVHFRQVAAHKATSQGNPCSAHILSSCIVHQEQN
ncbi:hypothetical protein ANCDUO_07645 [Ancylostoma duodenale]|uniref:Purple acid phosphatase C-terminal domain-containing protein n=1 Tax=Ancylostoma duodenale TaxID=51022 RepID=A0A0C2GY45_9BILA|nr:hypothetical protein ANCDUO_07645 [Ancylostoma duodenale]